MKDGVRARYTLEFKQEAVRLVRGGETLASAARTLGVSAQSLEQARHDLLEILEDRYGRKSTIVTSQLPTASWHHAIGDSTYADAILDRLLHNAHRVELEGDSLRRTKAPIGD
jgi:hypothetical protein